MDDWFWLVVREFQRVRSKDVRVGFGESGVRDKSRLLLSRDVITKGDSWD